MIEQSGKEEVIVPNPSYPKLWKEDATGILYWQLMPHQDLTDVISQREVSKAALAVGFTEQQHGMLSIENLSTVE
jgi:hypothetical protein